MVQKSGEKTTLGWCWNPVNHGMKYISLNWWSRFLNHQQYYLTWTSNFLGGATQNQWYQKKPIPIQKKATKKLAFSRTGILNLSWDMEGRKISATDIISWSFWKQLVLSCRSCKSLNILEFDMTNYAKAKSTNQKSPAVMFSFRFLIQFRFLQRIVEVFDQVLQVTRFTDSHGVSGSMWLNSVIQTYIREE